MASTQTTAVIERLLDDDYVHEQIAVAGAGLRDAYRRARRLPAQKAVQDQALYDRIRQTAAGLTEAARRAIGKPKPEPPRRRRGPLVLVMLAASAVVLWAAKNHRQTQQAPRVPHRGKRAAGANPDRDAHDQRLIGGLIESRKRRRGVREARRHFVAATPPMRRERRVGTARWRTGPAVDRPDG